MNAGERWERKTFRDYELPEGRTAESFLYKIEDLWSGSDVDTGYTDDLAEVMRMLAAGMDQAYDVRVTGRAEVWGSRTAAAGERGPFDIADRVTGANMGYFVGALNFAMRRDGAISSAVWNECIAAAEEFGKIERGRL